MIILEGGGRPGRWLIGRGREGSSGVGRGAHKRGEVSSWVSEEGLGEGRRRTWVFIGVGATEGDEEGRWRRALG